MSAIALRNRANSVPEDAGRSSGTRDELSRQLRILLADEDDGVRFHAATCAGALAREDLVPELIHGLSDPDEDVRAACAGALAKIRSLESEAALLRTLREDPAPDCKLAAIEGLSALSTTAAIPLLQSLIRGRGEDIVWSEHWEEGWDDWLDIQIAAIRALEHLGIEEAVADIEQALDDVEAQDLSAIACRAFSRLGEAGGAALDRCLQRGSVRLRREAIAALLENPRRENCARLRRLLRHQDVSVRAAAARALAAIDPVDESLVALLRDRDEQIVIAVLESCGHLHARALFSLAKHPRSKVRKATAHAIERMAVDLGHVEASLVTRVLPQLLADLEPEVVVAAITAAAAARRDGALPLLIRFVEDPGGQPETAAAAASALGELSGSAACPPLERAARSKHWQVRLAALAALARIAVRAGPGAELAVASLGRVIEEALEFESEQETPDPGTTSDTEPRTLESSRHIPVAVAKPQSTLDEIASSEPSLADDTGMSLEPEDTERLDSSALPRRRKSVPLGDDISTPPDAARLAVRALGQVPSAKSAALLVSALKSEDEVLRITALDALRRMLRHHGMNVRSIGNQSIELTDDGPEPVRVHAAMLSAALGEDRGYSVCAEFLRSGGLDARRRILEAMSHDEIRADTVMLDAVEPLLQVNELQSVALTALARARPDAVAAHLVDMLASGDESLQHAVHEILKSGVIKEDTVLDVLSQALEDPARARARPWLLEALTALRS